MSSRLGILHDPSQHVSYVQSWIKAIQKDPRAIHKACAQAERICDYLGVLDRHRTPLLAQEQEEDATREQYPSRESTMPQPRRGKGKSTEQPVAEKAPIDQEIDALWDQIIDKGKAVADRYKLAIDHDIGDGWGYQGHPNVEPEGKGGFMTKEDVYKHLGMTYGNQLDAKASRTRSAARHPKARPPVRQRDQEAELSR